MLQCKEENSTEARGIPANVMFGLKKNTCLLYWVCWKPKKVQNTYQEMVIMVGEENPVGLMVDEVISVEYLEKGDTLDALGSIRSEVLTRTMRSKRNSNIIYLLDEQKLLGQYQVALA